MLLAPLHFNAAFYGNTSYQHAQTFNSEHGLRLKTATEDCEPHREWVPWGVLLWESAAVSCPCPPAPMHSRSVISSYVPALHGVDQAADSHVFSSARDATSCRDGLVGAERNISAATARPIRGAAGWVSRCDFDRHWRMSRLQLVCVVGWDMWCLLKLIELWVNALRSNEG